MTKPSDALLRGIANFAEQVGLAQDHAGIHRALLEVADILTSADSLLVWQLDVDSAGPVCVFAAGIVRGRFRELDVSRLPFPPTATEVPFRAIREREAVLVDDVQSDDPRSVDAVGDGETDAARPRSRVVLPAIVLGDVVGAFELRSAEPAAFEEAHIVELQMAANLAAIATKNLELLERQRTALDRATAGRRLLRDVLEQAPTLTASLEGPDHVFTSANEKYRQFFAGRDILGRRVVDVLPEVRTQGIIDVLDRVYATGRSFVSHELPLDFIDDESGELVHHYFDVVYQALRGQEGQVRGVIAQAVDITDQVEARRQAQGLHAALQESYDRTIEGWARALDLKDEETAGHSQRVTRLAVELGRRMGMAEAELVHVRRGALLHDIGKMAVPDRILLKPEDLDAEEWEIMKRHTTHVYDFLSPIEHLQPAIDIPHYHHEKWDGSGYPHGLAGEEIPLAARIFAVVDVYDALTSDRPYREAWSSEMALEYIADQSGIHFDPRVVEAFLRLDASKHARGSTPAHHEQRLRR